MTTVPTAAVAARPGAPALGRAAAGLAVASALVHLLLLDASSLGSLAMAGMALVCLGCARHLWRAPTPSVWRLTAGLDAAMLLVHVQVPAGHGAAHVHAGGPGVLGWLGLGLVAGQLLVAGAVALRR
ncbi:hypothetical protein [Geodermatophilus sp. SYSU D00710]